MLARQKQKADNAAIADVLLAHVAQDPSFSRYADTRIYFRPLPRKIPVAGKDKQDYLNGWGMAEYDPSVGGLSTDPKVLRALRCIGDESVFVVKMLGIRSNGIRFLDTYREEDRQKTAMRFQRPCMDRVLPLMCVGDKWEIICPPENGGGNIEDRAVTPGELLIYRVDIVDVLSDVRTVQDAEVELQYYSSTSNNSRTRVFNMVTRNPVTPLTLQN